MPKCKGRRRVRNALASRWKPYTDTVGVDTVNARSVPIEENMMDIASQTESFVSESANIEHVVHEPSQLERHDESVLEIPNICSEVVDASVPELVVRVQSGIAPPSIKCSTKSWSKNYSAQSFLMNGQLFAEYERVTNMLGITACSRSQWLRIVQWTEKYVHELAEWSCEKVRRVIRSREDHQNWIASFDGFYLTRGHYFNNSSATLHDYTTGNVAWFTHRTKRGGGHNWEGTSNGAEGNMFDELLKKVKDEGFVIQEIVTDKDSSGNAIFCNHFPEGSITYCSNHSAKTLHKELQKIKANKCTVSNKFNK
uniref:Mutator-like transposase domain-containing protein n=1 Tax=Amphimedon queenslandica TaxID=400682 RepID=A0A1X7TLN0_AMPQE